MKIYMRFLSALFVLVACVQCALAQDSTLASNSDRISSRVATNIQQVTAEVAVLRGEVQKLKSTFDLTGSKERHEDEDWYESLEKRISFLNADVDLRMKTLFPASQENRAEAAGIIGNSRITAMRGGTGMEARLARYGNPSGVAKEVVAIASQQLPRDLIVSQLRKKFSNLEVGEVNDIIVSSFVHTGKGIPQLNEMGQQEALNTVKNLKKIKADNDRAPPEWFKAKK